MRQSVLLIIFVFLFTFSNRAQYVTIPDPGLRDYLLMSFPSCFNASNMLDTTCSYVVNATNFSPSGTIANWNGFQYFKNLETANFNYCTHTSLPSGFPASLKYLTTGPVGAGGIPLLPGGLLSLDCSDGGLTALPALPASLTSLNCEGNQLTVLPSLPTSLTYLDCSFNASLTSLPALPTSLQSIECEYCSIGGILDLPASLRMLECNNNAIAGFTNFPSQLQQARAAFNQVTSLPALPATLQILDVNTNNISGVLPALPSSLIQLDCSYNNNITGIPAPLPPGLLTLNFNNNQVTGLSALPVTLTWLSCQLNQLTVLPDLPPSLSTLLCSWNLLTSLPALPPGLTALDCSGNIINSLPPLSPVLYSLQCSNCNLYYLPALPASLNILECFGNPITCMPFLSSTQSYFEIIIGPSITCLPNAAPYGNLAVWDGVSQTSYNSTTNPYPVCNPINNSQLCNAYPVMAGHVFNVNNNNGVRDVGEPYRANIKIQLSNGAYTFTDNNGYYEIPANSIGDYNLNIVTPVYFTSVPLQYNYHFNTYDTLVTNDFALQATVAMDSLNIAINPVNAAARLGLSYPYLVEYENDGTTMLSPMIIFNYDNARLIYDSCSNTSVINNGTILSLSETGFVAGDRKNFVAYFHVNPSATIGDSIRAHATIHANSITVMDSTIVNIKGAYDPNDKEATPALSPAQVANGDEISYTIRFQNTGNDTAFNIIIADTLSSMLQAPALKMNSSSHPCNARVEGNIVYFEFINIQLPDSNVNKIKSHGYVSFSVKPQSNVSVNDIIPNKAAIYFDFNVPVITNTAETKILDPSGPLPLKLLSFNVSRQSKDAASVYWTTSNEINLKYFIIETSLDGRNYTDVVTENAKGAMYNNYTKQVSIPGTGVIYFRLMIVDLDGHTSYSGIVILKSADENTAFSFQGNPVKDVLIISIRDAELKNTTARIINAQGMIMQTFQLQHDVEYINIKNLASGTYFLQTIKGSSRFVVKN